MKDKTKYIIPPDCTIIKALKRMDELVCKLLIVMNGDDYLGLLSGGDIQRSIIKNASLEDKVEGIMRTNQTVARTTDSHEAVKELMISKRTEFMPILDDDNNLTSIVFWEDIFGEEKRITTQIDLPVIVMAGGKGTRLKPFSNILPKPLFPLGEKTILEEILDRFETAGSKKFYLSVNYKADFIKSYIDQIEATTYDITYFKEDKPLGTAGSLSLLKDKIKERFFVSNCDIVISANYSEIVDYHVKEGNEITLVGAFKHIKIPYGTLVTDEEGSLKELKEKPEMTYLVNSGLYILEPHLLEEIPEDSFYHITDLIDSVKDRKGKVGVFPVSEKSWCDIGEWDEYRRTLELLKH